MIPVTLDKTTYRPGEYISIELDFGGGLDRLDNCTNINVDIFRVDVERNNFAFGFGESPKLEGHKLRFTKKLPDTFTEGLYVVSGLRLIYGENSVEVKGIEVNDVNELFFWVSDREFFTKDELLQKIARVEQERIQFINAAYITPEAVNGIAARTYKVMVFAVGCLLHSPQIMKGYIIQPLGQGFSYVHMHEVATKYTQAQYGLALSRSDVIQSSFAQSTPLFVIDYQNVLAVNYEGAGSFCAQYSENIFTVLAYDRGQRPRSFATVIVDIETSEVWQAFHFPGYKGNLISDFDPSATANSLDRYMPKLESSPWVDLIMRIYADANTEQNRNYAFLKYWQILEMIAKKKITDNSAHIFRPNGIEITYPNGGPITTKYPLGKVYKFIFDSQAPSSFSQCGDGSKLIFESHQDATKNPNYDASIKVVTLWDTLASLYEIRNATAHSGEFNVDTAKCGTGKAKVAAELLNLQHGEYIRYVQSILWFVMAKEINAA